MTTITQGFSQLLHQVTTPYIEAITWLEHLPWVKGIIYLANFFRCLRQLFLLILTGRSPGAGYPIQTLI